MAVGDRGGRSVHQTALTRLPTQLAAERDAHRRKERDELRLQMELSWQHVHLTYEAPSSTPRAT